MRLIFPESVAEHWHVLALSEGCSFSATPLEKSCLRQLTTSERDVRLFRDFLYMLAVSRRKCTLNRGLIQRHGLNLKTAPLTSCTARIQNGGGSFRIGVGL